MEYINTELSFDFNHCELGLRGLGRVILPPCVSQLIFRWEKKVHLPNPPAPPHRSSVNTRPYSHYASTKPRYRFFYRRNINYDANFHPKTCTYITYIHRVLHLTYFTRPSQTFPGKIYYHGTQKKNVHFYVPHPSYRDRTDLKNRDRAKN